MSHPLSQHPQFVVWCTEPALRHNPSSPRSTRKTTTMVHPITIDQYLPIVQGYSADMRRNYI
jgi:hypothetical protein